ncbi:hypothetical protein CI102_1264 [Trichoderma harzianum]|nr:hypothetical protein CI102_1264 [Trichoderma harzianum]
MSGFEILGMACAVMQVISFAHELCTFCKDIYDGRPTIDTHREATAASMKSASEGLNIYFQSFSPRDDDQKVLVDISEKCMATAKELHTEAPKATAYHKPGSIKKSFGAFFKFGRHKKKIAELADALSGYRMTMETHLLARICKQGDAIQLQQSENFRNLSDSMKYFVSQLADGKTNMKNLIKFEARQTRDFITSSLTNHMREAIFTLQTDNQRRIFLESLSFSGMNERRCDVKPVHEATYRQLFDTAEAVGDDSGRELAAFRENFVAWLRNEGDTFWIQGKPGAGKSTLVKFLAEHHNTILELNRWSPEILIISHFFWKIGSLLQNNVKGLLCSLNHQLLSKSSLLLDELLSELPFIAAKHSTTDWDVRELKDILSRTLTRYQSSVCIFIDGLDEVAGKDEVEELLLTVELLRNLPNVKLCVSSRGEPIFCRYFSNAPSIKLHELTHGEMLKYATDILGKCPTTRAYSPLFLRQISSVVVKKAEGVFLWLHLVLRTLKIGLQNGDEESELLARLEQMPSELEKLYADMWARLNEDEETYQRSAAKYFKLAIASQTLQDAYYVEHEACTPGHGGVWPWKTSIFQVMLNKEARVREALLEKESQLPGLKFMGDFPHSCNDIVIRSAGLLEVYSQQTCRPEELYSPDDGPWKAMCSHVRFIHRTALDFLLNTAEGSNILAHEPSNEHDMALNFASSILCEMRYRNLSDSQDYDQRHCVYGSRMHRCRWLLGRVLSRSSCGQTRKQAEDLLETFESLFEARLLPWDQRPARYPLPSFGTIFIRDPAFEWFITRRCEDKGPSYATSILRDIWERMETHYHVPQPHDPHHVVQWLVSLGADLNCAHVCLYDISQFTASSPFVAMDTAFSRFLKHVVNNSTRSHVDGLRLTSGTLAAFLGAAPDLNYRTSFVIGTSTLENNPLAFFSLRSYLNGRTSSPVSPNTPLPPSFVDDDDYSVAIFLEVNLKFLVDEYIGSTTSQSGASSRYLSTAKALSEAVNVDSYAQGRFLSAFRGSFILENQLYRVIKPDIYENTLKTLKITRPVDFDDQKGMTDSHDSQPWACKVDLKRAVYKYVMDSEACERVAPSILLTTLADEKLGVCRV